MNQPERARDLTEELCRLLPGLRPRGPLRRTTKSHLLRGSLDGLAVVVKRLARPASHWAWYFERELQLYQSFASAPPPVRLPRLLLAHPEQHLLVLEELPGRPLSQRRRCETAVGPALLQELVRLPAALASWERGLALAPTSPPPLPHRRRLRLQLLEDPSAPLGWVLEGIRRCGSLGILPATAVPLLEQALLDHPTVSFGHGDLLPRNLLVEQDQLGLVDWECAGAHPQSWDRALLWVNLPAAREPLQASLGSAPAPVRAFWACVAFALGRELKFRRRVSAGLAVDPVTTRLQGELAATLARLRDPWSSTPVRPRLAR